MLERTPSSMSFLYVMLMIIVYSVSPSTCFDSIYGLNQTYCVSSSTCGNCLTVDPACTWCTDEGYSATGNPRCDVYNSLIDKGCINITDPHGSYTVIQDDPLGDADKSPTNKTVQVSPQHVKLILRQGASQKITLYARPALDYPLDLYYLMDLSKSMVDDLTNLRQLGPTLARELKLLSSDVQMGFGSFVDKVALPFVHTDPNLLKLQCGETYICDEGFGVRNNLNLTTDLDKFSEMVMVASYSTSVTGPEGGMDALMQMVVCKDVIGWRDGARHILVYTSDNTVHVAGDGRLAAIYTPNDGLCHMDPITNEYSKTTDQDFPTIAHLNSKIKENGLYPIFAVVEKRQQFYTKMASDITSATVGILAADSSNIINIIKDQYNAISSTIELIDSAPDGIDVFYTAHCSEGDSQPGGRVCTGLSLGQTVSFDLEITATSCVKGETHGFTVKPFGIEDKLLIEVEVICSCDCETNGIPNSDKCTNGNGTYACGQCNCNADRYGPVCECDVETGGDEGVENCYAKSDSSVVCSGRGSCFCGQCQCFNRQNPEEIVSGPFCQCDNFSCDRYNGELCGGPDRGKCTCDERTWKSKCVCNKGYTGNACQCPDNDKACKASTGLVCNGYGNCVCGKCQCDPNSSFRGPTCEDCGICEGDCGIYRECVLCKAFNEGTLTPEECAQCSMIVVVEKQLRPRNDTIRCETLNQENCTVVYYYETLHNGTVLVHVQKDSVCPQHSVSKTEPWIIVLAIIIAILILGLLLILLLKCYIHHLDKKEFAEFEKDRQQARWDASTNPIYKSSTTRHANPMYGGGMGEGSKVVYMSAPPPPDDDLKTEL